MKQSGKTQVAKKQHPKKNSSNSLKKVERGEGFLFQFLHQNNSEVISLLKSKQQEGPQAFQETVSALHQTYGNHLVSHLLATMPKEETTLVGTGAEKTLSFKKIPIKSAPADTIHRAPPEGKEKEKDAQTDEQVQKKIGGHLNTRIGGLFVGEKDAAAAFIELAALSSSQRGRIILTMMADGSLAKMLAKADGAAKKANPQVMWQISGILKSTDERLIWLKDQDVLEKIARTIPGSEFLPALAGASKSNRQVILSSLSSLSVLPSVLSMFPPTPTDQEDLYYEVIDSFPESNRLYYISQNGALVWFLEHAMDDRFQKTLAAASPLFRIVSIQHWEGQGKMDFLIARIDTSGKKNFSFVMEALPTKRIELLTRYEPLRNWVSANGDLSYIWPTLAVAADADREKLLGMLNLETMITSTILDGQKAYFQTIYEKVQDPEKKARLMEAALTYKAEKEADNTQPGKGKITHGPKIIADTKKEAAREMTELMNAYKKELRKTRGAKAKKRVEEKYRSKIEGVMTRKEKELEVEVKHNVRITIDTSATGREFRFWTEKELAQIDASLERLPDEHVDANRKLKEIKREDVYVDASGKKSPGTGGTHSSSGVITIYDSGLKGKYRATGETSELGGHSKKKGRGPAPAAGAGPLSPLEETLVHEIGHDVAKIVQIPIPGPGNKKEDVEDTFARLSGWESLTKQNVIDALKVDMSEDQAKKKVKKLEKDRKKDYYDRTQLRQGKWVYLIDPYDSTRYCRYKAGFIPGDKDSPESSRKTHTDYARSNPADHFAEMYTHMVHVPERTYKDYVELPFARMEKAKEKYNEARAAHQKLVDKKAAGETVSDKSLDKAKTARDKAKEEYDLRKEQYEAMKAQWDLMKEKVFGVTPAVIAQAEAVVLNPYLLANPAKSVEINGLIAEFRKATVRVATVWQLYKMTGEYAVKIASL